MVFCPRWVQVSCASVGLVLFAAVLIIGIIVPDIIEYKIQSGVRSSVPLEKGYLSDAQYQNFTSSTIDAIYYIFNITNINDVMATGAVPNVVASPAVHLLKHTNKINIVSNNGLTSYTACISYEVADQASWNIMQMPVTVPNLAYFGGIAQIARAFYEQAEINSGILPGDNLFVQPNLVTAGASLYNDLLLNIYAQSQLSLWPTFNKTFASPTGQLVPGFKMLGVAVYFQAAIKVLITAGVTGYTPATAGGLLAAHIASAGAVYPAATVASLAPPQTSVFAGLEFPAALKSTGTAQFAGQVAALFNQTGSYGLLSVNGLTGFWPTVLTLAGQAQAGNLTAVPLFQAKALELVVNTGIDPADVNTVVGWLSKLVGPALTADSSTDFYSLVVFNVVKANVASYNWFTTSTSPYYNNAQFFPTTWSDLALFQFGSGMVTSMFLDSLGGTSLGTNGIATSVSDNHLLGTAAQGGLGIATEFAASCATLYNPPVLLTSAQSKFILNFLANSNVVYPAVFNLVASKASATIAKLATLGVPASVALNIVVYGLAAGANPAFPSGIAGVCDALSCTANGVLKADTDALIQLYLSSPNFPACALTHMSNINRVASVTTPSLASGMFITLTVGEAIFGQLGSQAGLGGAQFPGVAAYWQNVTGPVVGKLGATVTPAASLASCAISEATRPYIQVSGSADLSALGQFRQFEGVSSYQKTCDYYDPASVDLCSGPDPPTKFPIPSVANWPVYGTPVTVVGSYDGQYFPPLQEGSIVPNYSIWVPNVIRPVNFLYSSPITYKNINLRRYRIDPNVLFNATNTATNPGDNVQRNGQYWYTDTTFPGGLLNFAGAHGGVPLSVSQPHLVGVDPAVRNLITGLDNNAANYDALYISNVDIEPLSGRTMNAAKRLQANVFIDPAKYSFFPVNSAFINSLKGQTIHIPLYWAQESATISDSDADSFVSAVYGNRDLGKKLQIAGIVLGSFFIIVFGILLYRAVKPSQAESTN